MTIDARDRLWDVILDTYYIVYFYERVADRMVDRWQFVDECSKGVIAVTASGSAVAGWTLWSQAGWAQIWGGVAGLAATLAILHPALTVPRRLTDWGDSKRTFTDLRVETETLIQKIRMNPEFPLDEYQKEFLDLRKKYKDCLSTIRNDFLLTKKLKVKCQNELDVILGWSPQPGGQ